MRVAFLNRAACYFLGHKRRIRAHDMPREENRIWFRCPRCGDAWLRKERKVKVAT